MNTEEKIVVETATCRHSKDEQGEIFDNIVELLGKSDYDTLLLIRAYTCILIKDMEAKQDERDD